MSLPVASFKLQLAERRVRIVPARGLDDCPFAGPGVDVVGDAAAPLLEGAAPMIAWVRAREPGAVVRSLSLDVARRRVLLTYVPAGAPPDMRPHVLRVDAPLSNELVDLAGPLMKSLGELARVRLAAR